MKQFIPVFLTCSRAHTHTLAQIEESAKRSVEGASSGAAILKLYNKWHEKMLLGESAGGEDSGRVATHSSKEKKGLLSKVKASIQKTTKVSDLASMAVAHSGWSGNGWATFLIHFWPDHFKSTFCTSVWCGVWALWMCGSLVCKDVVLTFLEVQCFGLTTTHCIPSTMIIRKRS